MEYNSVDWRDKIRELFNKTEAVLEVELTTIESKDVKTNELHREVEVQMYYDEQHLITYTVTTGGAIIVSYGLEDMDTSIPLDLINEIIRIMKEK